MQRTKIEWATHTWNPVVGCSKVSAGCENCYAEAMVHRFPGMTGEHEAIQGAPQGWDGRAHFKPERLEEPFHLRPGEERPHRIFVCSMSDLFHESLTNEQIAAVFGVMAATPQHQYIVLTKRPQRAVDWYRWVSSHRWTEAVGCADQLLAAVDHDGPIACKYGPAPDVHWPLPSVIMCASVEGQESADERIPLLLQIPAACRGVSVEPMLGPVDLRSNKGGTLWIGGQRGCDGMHRGNGSLDCPSYPHHHHDDRCKRGVDWVICGAETGPGKRPFRDEWAMDLRDQCKNAGVPFFFKEDGNGNGTLCGVEYREWIGG